MDQEQEIDSGVKNVSIVAAIGRGRELGRAGELLWRLPDDLKRFKTLTVGHPVVMGRKTWESLPERFRPLPDRTNIVVTRQAGYEAAGAVVVDSFEAARAVAARAPGGSEVFVIGGGELYTLTLPIASRLYLTLVDATAPADTYFPAYENDFKLVSSEPGEGDPPHTFTLFDRK